MAVEEDRELIEMALHQQGSLVDDSPELEGSVVTGWVVVAERMAIAGDRWLTCLCSEDLTAWARTGLLTHAMQAGWEDEDAP